MKLDIPSLGILSIDFEYVRIPRKVFSEVQVGPDGTIPHPSAVKVTWKLKTICKFAIGETQYQTHVWKASQHEHGFNLKEERKRALTKAMKAMFPNLNAAMRFVDMTIEGRDTRRAIWAALHAQGFHPFPVSRVTRLTKMLIAAQKRAKRRAEKKEIQEA